MASNPKVYTDRSNAAKAAKRLGGTRVRVPTGWVVEMPDPEFEIERARALAATPPQYRAMQEQHDAEARKLEAEAAVLERRADGFYAITPTGETGPFVTQKLALVEAKRLARGGFERLGARAKGKPAPKPVTKAKPESAARPQGGERAAVAAAAAAGKLPPPPDFTANTHKPYRAKLQKLVDLAQAGDVKGLRAVEIKPTSTSPRAMLRYRDLAVTALSAKAAG